jgi:hypothetical protein
VSQSGLGDQLGNKTTAHAGLDVSHSHRPLDLPLDSCPTDALLVADLLVATRRRRQGASTWGWVVVGEKLCSRASHSARITRLAK